MKCYKTLCITLLFLAMPISLVSAGDESKELFPTLESKDAFAREMSFLMERAWKNWQDSVRVDNIEVNGSYGRLIPGDLGGPTLTAYGIMASFDRKGKSQDYIDCVRAVAEAVENGMRKWQRNYTHSDIPFPQGASCTYTMPPSNNMPVIIATGTSSGDKDMDAQELYNYMLYRSPKQEGCILVVFKGAAKAVSERFKEWKNSCSIVGILASGGIAPQPAPMGSGPGPVRGAKGKGGKLIGPYFNGARMYEKMAEYFRISATDASSQHDSAFRSGFNRPFRHEKVTSDKN